jgi:Curli production assembly/transport component CsgG
MWRNSRLIKFSVLLLLVAVPGVCAQESQSEQNGDEQLVDAPVAILPFRERGEEVKGMGGQASDLLFAGLVTDAALWLVDREDLEKTLSEQELNLSGVVKPEEAVKIGQITGAKILITGSIFQAGKSMYVVAKVIGTETTRVFGASAKGSVGDGLDSLMPQLSKDVASLVKSNVSKLVAKPIEKADRIKALKEELGDRERPSVLISVAERHVGREQFDPAAETELTLFCKEVGFTVVDGEQGSPKQADILIKGEGISEFAVRRGNLISVKARLEVKAIDRATGKVIAADRQTRVAVDLSEQIAAKNTLQEAAADIAVRLLPKLVQPKTE